MRGVQVSQPQIRRSRHIPPSHRADMSVQGLVRAPATTPPPAGLELMAGPVYTAAALLAASAAALASAACLAALSAAACWPALFFLSYASKSLNT
jgi:hypothetical protein